MGVLEAIDRHLNRLRAALATVSPDQLSGPDAARLVERGVDLERLGVATRTLYAKRVADTRAFEKNGHRDAASWLAGVSGESTGAAKGLLEVAEKLAEAPLVGEAFSDGKLSLAQARVVAGAGALNPSSQEQLLRSAETDSLRELRVRADRAKRSACGEATQVAKEARAYNKRRLRFWSTPGGGVRFEGLLPTVDGARVQSALEAERKVVFRQARRAGRRTADDAYLADAFVRVVCGEARHDTEVSVQVDAGALTRGWVEGDERCEIPGVGPIPVSEARSLLADSWVRLLVGQGSEIQTVTSRKRTIPKAVRAAVYRRDGGRCVVPRCPNSKNLQFDHDWEFAKGGPTSLDNLQLLCPHHHRQKTLFGFGFVRGPDGEKRWVGPD